MHALLRLIVVVALVMLPSLASAQSRRVALVIGNGAYRHVEQLTNPVNDATAVGQALQRLDFDKVTVLRNLGAEDLRRALLSFESDAAGADIALVYFAGHGMEVDGQNYLIPTDARLARSAAIEVEAIPLATVTAMMTGARKLRLVILDACRNNPFRVQMMNDSTGKRRSIGRGLGRIEPSENELVAYAAAGGTEADDGSGRHSPFTSALLKHIEVPGLEVGFLFRHVRDDVMAATGRQQQPHLYGTLGREPIYLRRGEQPVAALQVPVAPPSGARESGPREFGPRTGNTNSPTVAANATTPSSAGASGAAVDNIQPRKLSMRVRIARQSVDEKGSRGWLGINMSAGTDSLAKMLGIGAVKGSWVKSVVANGPALAAGIKPGDLIVKLDGREIVKWNDLPNLVQLIPIDSEAEVELWRFGQGIDDALRFLRSRAEAGDAEALTTIASIYSEGIGVSADQAEAGRWLRRGADAGNAFAMSDLGTLYYNGRGLGKDLAEAARWYRRAALGGDPRGMNSLGWLLAEGEGIEKDEAEAVRWYRKAAEAGLALAMENLGDMYGNGRGIARDDAEAVRWYRKAADGGDIRALNSMGWMYQNGRGVAKDYAEAMRWYRKGADAGNSTSVNNMGWMHYNGFGVPKDMGEALRWYRKAADAGNTTAMQNLGMALDDGRGAARDRATSAAYMLKALRAGHEKALQQMRNNTRNWSVEFRRELQRLLREAGAYDGPIDGNFGKPTMAAIEAIFGKEK